MCVGNLLTLSRRAHCRAITTNLRAMGKEITHSFDSRAGAIHRQRSGGASQGLQYTAQVAEVS